MHRFPGGPGLGTLVIPFILSAIACASSDASLPGGLREERIERGDTLIVRVSSGSVWGTTARLVEEVRIGALDGPDDQIIGLITAAAPDGQRGVYVFDSQAPALRHYDATGALVRTLGGRGSGPGEYQDVALGLWVRKDGTVLMRDPRNARINAYTPDGEPADQWLVSSGLYTSNAMVVDTAGEVYLKVLLEQPEPNRPWRMGMLHLSATGEIIDTIPEPSLAGEPESPGGTFTVSKQWVFSPLGYIVAGVNGTYTFELRKPDGVVRVVMPHEPVPVGDEEHAELEAANDFMWETQGHNMTAPIPPVPRTKPAYSTMYTGHDGRIWIRPHVASVKFEPPPRSDPPPGAPPQPPQRTWREPVVYDVFEPDGTYLGRVEVPERTSLLTISGSEIWAVQRGEFDESYLVRYRLAVGQDTGGA
jgi:hypothetical protein